MKQLLSKIAVPDEAAAEERAWETVRSAYAAREPVPRRRSRWRFAPVPVVAGVATAIALSPAGAAVHRWIDHTLGLRHANPGVFSLPAPGRVLVSGATGTWTVSADGVKRRIGPWREASWSPRGLYVLLAGRDQLVAADPHGIEHWSVSRPAIRFPRWSAMPGWRVAYLSADALEVIAGDGTNPRALAGHVAPVAPAWRPGQRWQLAYVTAHGDVVLRDSDTRLIAWSRAIAGVRGLAWSPDGSRLLVRTARGVRVLRSDGAQLAQLGTDAPTRDAALSPAGDSFAVLAGDEVTLTSLRGRTISTRRLLGTEGLRQLVFSPDGRWLLVTLPAANQWVFVHVTGRGLIPDSRISQQFGGAMPHLDGWCCAPSGGSG
jgi:WD40 repeat protein